MKKIISLFVAVVMMCMLFAACGQEAPATDEGSAVPEPAPAPVAEEESESTKAILVVSFGTSYNESRDITIGAVEEAITAAYPDYDVRRAFTSQIIIDILAERESLEIDNVEQAMDKLVADGITELIVQPTHLMNGYEYDDIVAEIENYKDQFETLAIGAPLLSSEEDFAEVISVITAETASLSNDETAIVFMGHGTEHEANAVYSELQEKLWADGYANYFVGTVEAEPTVEEILAVVQSGSYTTVVLQPLMVVSGDHASNDMAGDEEDSWKTIFTDAGYQVETVLRGLGEFAGIQQIYVKHVQAAIDLAANGGDPVYADALDDGTYTITVESSSSMFKVVDAQLTVSGSEMTAVLTLSGTGYEKLYMGTGEEALNDSDDKCIYFAPDAEGSYTYEVPVTALNEDIDVAAWSIRKQEWYDRILVFESASLPDEAFAA